MTALARKSEKSLLIVTLLHHGTSVHPKINVVVVEGSGHIIRIHHYHNKKETEIEVNSDKND